MSNYVVGPRMLMWFSEAVIEYMNKGHHVFVPYSVFKELEKHKDINMCCRDGETPFTLIRDYMQKGLTLLAPLAKDAGNMSFEEIMLCEIMELKDADVTVLTNNVILQILLGRNGVKFERFPPVDQINYSGFLGAGDLLVNNGILMKDGSAYVYNEKYGQREVKEHTFFGVRPSNISQNILFDFIIDEDINIISVNSRSGTGKTFIALLATLYLLLHGKERRYEKIIIVAPRESLILDNSVYSGATALPPYVQTILNYLKKISKDNHDAKYFINMDTGTLNDRKIEIIPCTHLQRYMVQDNIVIVDNMQQLSHAEASHLMRQISCEGKLICMGDINNASSVYFGLRVNGLSYVLNKYYGQKNYAHLTLSPCSC